MAALQFSATATLLIAANKASRGVQFLPMRCWKAAALRERARQHRNPFVMILILFSYLDLRWALSQSFGERRAHLVSGTSVFIAVSGMVLCGR